jgi:hypothetical protein
MARVSVVVRRDDEQLVNILHHLAVTVNVIVISTRTQPTITFFISRH